MKCIALSLDEKVETYEETYQEWIKDIQKYHAGDSIYWLSNNIYIQRYI